MLHNRYGVKSALCRSQSRWLTHKSDLDQSSSQEKLVDMLHKCMFWQRPIKSLLSRVGVCASICCRDYIYIYLARPPLEVAISMGSGSKSLSLINLFLASLNVCHSENSGQEASEQRMVEI